MTYTVWKGAVAALEARLAPATEDQKAAASAVGIVLDPALPGLVAAQIISAHLFAPVRPESSKVPSEDQIEYARRLARATKSAPVAPEQLAHGPLYDAWIEILHDRRAKMALERLKPEAGDIVIRSNGDLEQIASIGADGQVYFAGGLGARERIHKLKIKHRRTSGTRGARAARKQAANVSARRRSSTLSRPPPAQRMAELDRWVLSSHASSADRAILEDVVDDASDEAPIQEYLTAHPEVFRALLRGNLVNAAIPWPRLGGQFVPDFLLVEADSAGLHWTLVELESPRKRPLNRDGKLSPKTREAIAQIESWREWLTDNIDYARRPKSQSGLGLIDVRPDRTNGLVLIGRREDVEGLPTEHRTRVARDSRSLVQTYDWFMDLPVGHLVTGLRHAIRAEGGDA